MYNRKKHKKREEFMYDIVIIGGGAAGLSAAIYACRGGMKTIVLEAVTFGGQINYTYDVDNYPGFFNTPKGEELSQSFLKHAEKFGAEISAEKVRDIENYDKSIKTVVTRRNRYETKAIIFATGAVPRKLGVKGEDAFSGLGVSYCATCDGAFFKGQTTLVCGGGNTAFEDALYLAGVSSDVYLVHRSEKYRANAALIDKVKNNPKITLIPNTVIDEIRGKSIVDGAVLKNTLTGELKTIETAAVFVAIGRIAQSELAGRFVRLTNDGFIQTDRQMQTNVCGIFASGDVRDTPLRQIVTAAADGAVAAVSAINYING